MLSRQKCKFFWSKRGELGGLGGMSNFQTLISRAKIDERNRQLGSVISEHYQTKVSTQAPLLLGGILKGSFVFLADLIRQISVPLEVDFLEISSYEGTHSSGEHRIHKDFRSSIEGRHILLVEDIVDTGLTLNFLMERLKQKSPASLKICSFLSKPSCRQIEVDVDYIGFEIEDHFVVGYGLDFNQQYRHLPEVQIYAESES